MAGKKKTANKKTSKKVNSKKVVKKTTKKKVAKKTANKKATTKKAVTKKDTPAVPGSAKAELDGIKQKQKELNNQAKELRAQAQVEKEQSAATNKLMVQARKDLVSASSAVRTAIAKIKRDGKSYSKEDLIALCDDTVEQLQATTVAIITIKTIAEETEVEIDEPFNVDNTSEEEDDDWEE